MNYNNDLSDLINSLLKIAANIVIFAYLKTLIIDTANVSSHKRYIMLVGLLIAMIFNYFGIYRNAYTIGLYFYTHLALSVAWLMLDIMQLIYCLSLFIICYLKSKISKIFTRALLIMAIIFLIANIYNFIVNFFWFSVEGMAVFIFWAANNSIMIIFSLLAFLLLRSNKKIAKDI